MEIKNIGIPVYRQIEQDLKEKIENGYYRIGDRFTEKDLVKIYKVSRLTLKKATSLLAAEGYLSQIPGKGTFITSPDEQNSIDVRAKKMNRGIGILVSSITGYLYPGIIRGAEDVCEKAGYHMVLGNYDAIPEKEKKYMEGFVQRGLAGLIIAPSYNSHLNPYYKKLKEKDIPFVLVDITVKGVEADLVATDNFKGGYLGTKFLIQNGCKNILFISTSLKASSTRDRLLGYKHALEEAKVPFNKEMVKEITSGHPHYLFAEEITRYYLSQNKIDGIFSANEPLIFGVLKAVKEKQVNSEEVVKIVSFDKPEIPLELVYPVSFITQPRYEIGRIACQLLFERIKEKRQKKQRHFLKNIFLQPGLIEAGSREEIINV